jgi:hypothetical protein
MGWFVRESAAEEHARIARASSFDNDVAKERGRLFAARAIIENPEQRIRGEIAFGLNYMKARYPEAYRRGWWKGVLKWIPRFHPTDQS